MMRNASARGGPAWRRASSRRKRWTFCNLFRLCGLAGADRPDGLVGNRQARAVGEVRQDAALKLGFYHLHRVAGVALRPRSRRDRQSAPDRIRAQHAVCGRPGRRSRRRTGGARNGRGSRTNSRVLSETPARPRRCTRPISRSACSARRAAGRNHGGRRRQTTER